MPYQPFTADKPTHHTLDDGYVLQSAPEREFGVNYAIYRNVNPEFDEFLDYGADLQGCNYCFWIVKENQKIGGIILRPHHVEGLFLRPPCTQAFDVLRAILPLLQSWSDRAKPIEAVDVMPHELELYQRLGFKVGGARRVYIRPTECFRIDWERRYQVVCPSRPHVAEAAALFELAYRDYPAEWALGRYSLEDWIRRTEKRLGAPNVPQVCERASTLVRDLERGRIVGCCIVRLSPSIVRPEVRYAKVEDIAVHPAYRRRGLWRRMLQHALSALHGQFPVLKFGVAVGNTAEAFYHSLGFLPGVTHYKLLMPVTITNSP